MDDITLSRLSALAENDKTSTIRFDGKKFEVLREDTAAGDAPRILTQSLAKKTRRIQELEALLKDAENLSGNGVEVLRDTVRERDELRGRLRRAEAHAASAREHTKQVQLVVGQTREELEALQEVRDLEAKNSVENIARAEALRTEIARIQEERDTLEEQLADAEQIAAAQKVTLDDRAAALMRLVGEKNAAEGRVELLSANLKAAQSGLQEAVRNNDKITAGLEELQRKFSAHKRRQEELEGSHDALRTALNQMNSDAVVRRIVDAVLQEENAESDAFHLDPVQDEIRDIILELLAEASPSLGAPTWKEQYQSTHETLAHINDSPGRHDISARMLDFAHGLHSDIIMSNSQWTEPTVVDGAFFQRATNALADIIDILLAEKGMELPRKGDS